MDENRIVTATKALILNTMLNTYAIERVAFGYEQPGEKAPIDKYLSDLHLELGLLHKRSDIPGVYIDEQECIRADQDKDEYIRDLFVYKMESVFATAPKDARAENRGDEIPILPRFREYVFSLLPLFGEVIQTEVEYDCFDLLTANESLYITENAKWCKFITAVLVKPLKSGGRIDRYVSDFQYTLPYIKRLIEERGGHYYLTTADINALEYKFAVFAAMLFMNRENNGLLELKMQAWEKAHR